jgi:hypothetical protein
MAQTIKLSDDLVKDAAIAGIAAGRPVNSQIEYWVALGKSMDPILTGKQVRDLLERDSEKRRATPKK